MSLGQQMPSQVFQSGHLRIRYAPRLSSGHPHYLDPRSISDAGAIYLLGDGFLELQELQGSLRCVLSLELEGGTSSTVLAS